MTYAIVNCIAVIKMIVNYFTVFMITYDTVNCFAVIKMTYDIVNS